MHVRRSTAPPFDTDPIRSSRRLAGMPNPELIWIIVALVMWIVLLGTLSQES